ncbi:MAG: hypothetical protein C0176_02500 [Mesoaciditoga sp.]|uniref:hypothetical protein n=1 Tax=Athalassotoga sp. TaxID=2022597 RepID=UPI000CBF6E0D|nr:MAG: hypothetical protein C0185_01100 [Mesoaciditoga sp.]PMP80302.1 MAG: hypothetical protein C0176_02500 [Mesoaciditoga sp.]HEU25037.1 hypothetical protein [Mesoaciditoga lauensis]
MKIYMGSILSSTEFTKFDLGITFGTEISAFGKWIRSTDSGILFEDSGFGIYQRKWRIPITLDEIVFQTDLRIATLYNEELRMRDLLLKIPNLKIDLVVGYLRTQNYNPYELIASGWGCAQTTGIPTILVNVTGENVNYSFFTKMSEFNDGMIVLSDRYTMINFQFEKKEYTQNNKEAQEK